MSRGPLGRAVAMLLIAAVAVPLAPHPAAASPMPCHVQMSGPSVQAGHQQDAPPCGHCSQASCLAMPGCAQPVALAVTPAPTPRALQDSQVSEPEVRVANDLASPGPPTPPPNS